MEQKREYQGTCIGFIINGERDLKKGNFVRDDILYSEPERMELLYRIQFKGEKDYIDVDESSLLSCMSGTTSLVWRIDNLRHLTNVGITPAFRKVIPYIRSDGREYCRLYRGRYMDRLINDENLTYILGVTGHGTLSHLRSAGYEVVADSENRYSLRALTLRKENRVYVLFDCDRVYLDWETSFSGCKANKLSFSPYIDTSNLSSFAYMFHDVQIGCLDLSGLNTSNAVKMEAMFYKSTILKFKFGGLFDTSKVTNMSGMFSDLNNNIAHWSVIIDVSKLNVSLVRNMRSMFSSCNAKISGLSTWDTRNVTAMDLAFYGSYIISGDKLKNWDVSHVDSFERMFMGTGANVIDISTWNMCLSREEQSVMDMNTGDNRIKLMYYLTGGEQLTKIKFPMYSGRHI